MESETIQLILPSWDMLPDIGLYNDQVVTCLVRIFRDTLPKGEITKTMINNYVKAGLVSKPVSKKYDREQIAQMIIISFLKQALSMDGIHQLFTILFAESVEKGYNLFYRHVQDLEEAARAGHLEIQWDRNTPDQTALLCAFTGALCTIKTYSMLSEIKEL